MTLLKPTDKKEPICGQTPDVLNNGDFWNLRENAIRESRKESARRLRKDLSIIAAVVVPVLLFLGAIAVLSGCNNFQPQCISDCYSGIARVNPL